MSAESCNRCLKLAKQNKALSDENERLQQLIDALSMDLNDRVELIEYIRNELNTLQTKQARPDDVLANIKAMFRNQ